MIRPTSFVERFRMRWISAALVGLACGVTMWALSPIVFGTIEPWDAESAYYFVSLFVSGALAWVAFRKNARFFVVGLYVGQLAYLLVVGLGPLAFVGLVLLIPYCLIAGAGALFAYVFLGNRA